LIQLIKLWGGYIVAACRTNAVSLIKALGADDVIVIGESDIDKELQLYDKYKRARLNILKIISYINNLCKKNTKISFNYITFRSRFVDSMRSFSLIINPSKSEF